MKNNNLMVAFSVAVIAIGSIGGVVYANNLNQAAEVGQKPVVVESRGEMSFVSDIDFTAPNLQNNRAGQNFNANSENNPYKDHYQDMIKLMRKNGFNDPARFMQTGDFDAMTDYMNDLSQEDFEAMIEIMNDNGYGYMGQMMESVGIEGMVDMHNTMHGSGGFMMGGSY